VTKNGLLGVTDLGKAVGKSIKLVVSNTRRQALRVVYPTPVSVRIWPRRIYFGSSGRTADCDTTVDTSRL
jgi:hypothetical protein